MTTQFNAFADGAALAEALAIRVAGVLENAIAVRGSASLAVSGGSTPKAFFKALSSQDIDWAHVTITLVDERFVPPENDRSNHALVQAGLLQNKAAKAKFIPLYHAVARIDDAAFLATTDIRPISKPFDVVILGMGGDGHTASFFPGGDNLEMALSPKTPRSVVTMQAEGAGEARLTLTFSALQDARMLALHIETAAKKAVLDQALEQGEAGPLPIARVIAGASANTEIYWAP